MSTSVFAAPGAGQPLALSRGEVRCVTTVRDLKTALEAANRAKVATTILLEDGTYLLDVPALEIKFRGVIMHHEQHSLTTLNKLSRTGSGTLAPVTCA